MQVAPVAQLQNKAEGLLWIGRPSRIRGFWLRHVRHFQDLLIELSTPRELIAMYAGGTSVPSRDLGVD